MSPSFNGHVRGPSAVSGVAGGSKTVGRWLKDRREKKREETRAQNAQLHAAVSVAGVAAAVAAISVATASQSSSGSDEQVAKTDSAVASAATLVAAQCVEAAEIMGADREHLASVVSSAVNVRYAGDIMTLTAAAATGIILMPYHFYVYKFRSMILIFRLCQNTPYKSINSPLWPESINFSLFF